MGSPWMSPTLTAPATRVLPSAVTRHIQRAVGVVGGAAGLHILVGLVAEGRHRADVLLILHQHLRQLAALGVVRRHEGVRAAALDQPGAARPLGGAARPVGDLGLVGKVRALRRGQQGKAVEEGHELRARHRPVRGEGAVAHAVRDADAHGPAHRRVKPNALGHVGKAAARADGGLARHAPQRRHQRGARHRALRVKAPVAGAVHKALRGAVVHRRGVPRVVRDVGIGRRRWDAQRQRQKGAQRKRDELFHGAFLLVISLPPLRPWLPLEGGAVTARRAVNERVSARTAAFSPLRPFGAPVSLWLGHPAAFICPRHVIHSRGAASLPQGARQVRWICPRRVSRP